MLIAGLVLAAAAGLLHAYIFYLESIAWTSKRARAVFGTGPEEARATKELAFNQGFYNLFLAVAVAAGIVAFAVDAVAVGTTLVFVGAGSMVAAALVLFWSSPDKRSAALKQGLLPLLGVALVGIGLAV